MLGEEKKNEAEVGAVAKADQRGRYLIRNSIV
jgi:hypothetical protein